MQEYGHYDGLGLAELVCKGEVHHLMEMRRPSFVSQANWKTRGHGSIVGLHCRVTHRISDTFGVAAHAGRDLGLQEAKDLAIFQAAREAGAVLMSKDSDFVLLLERFGPPPQRL